jgi:hypothetical protein
MILFVRRIRNFFGYSLYLFAAFFASTVLVFAVAEKSQGLRSLLNLSAIRYFDFLDRYQPDPELVFVPRHKELSFEYETKGDIYSPYFSVDVDIIKLTGAYNAMAFRSVWPDNGVDLLVIGDSFVEIGETDSDLLSERIGMEAGLVTVNFGRGWYGPYQYLELLRRYGLSFGASCALFSLLVVMMFAIFRNTKSGSNRDGTMIGDRLDNRSLQGIFWRWAIHCAWCGGESVKRGAT